MRKQVAYEYRLLKVSAVDPTASRQILSGIVNEYLANGWELFKVETVRAEGNESFISYHFVQYADEPVVTKAK